MRQFFDPNISFEHVKHTLPEEESKHIVRVLRMQNGEKIEVLNGKGERFTCVIREAHPKKCQIEILEHKIIDPEDKEIHIAVSPTKQMDRIEWFVEKATEIGITHISFLSTQNAERNQLKLDRLSKKAVSAMKQSKRYTLPIINNIINIKEFVVNHPNGLIAHCMDDEMMGSIANELKPLNCPILIGPEGDFTKEEVHLALQNGYKTITLGKNRLRTETAALYACMQAKITLDGQ